MNNLRERFAHVLAGTRQCVFVTGGPGSGKTAVIEAFIREAETGSSPARVIIGHCFEQFGTSEPYMPVWEALGRLCGQQAPASIGALLERHVAAQASAPTATASEPRGMSERLLRELTDGIEALASESPLILVLEDLHWADFSTLDLVSALARRRHAPARLLVLATYRPAAVSASDHPLRAVAQGLLAGGMARELALPFLDESAVNEYLSTRFGGGDFPKSLAHRLHQRTDGHPLFLVHLVDDLIEQGVLVRTERGWTLASEDADEPEEGVEVSAWQAVLETQVPRTVRAMIELQLERLQSRERSLLEAAAVAGVESSAAAVAAALEGDDVVVTEEGCDALAQRHRFLEPRGLSEWPDGTAATHYRFVHELYHNVVYERVPSARRSRMHRAIGLRMEEAWGARAAEEAATLAMHFEAGRDWPRAIRHLRQAALAATRQYAHREAVRYLRRAIDLLDRVSPADRAEHELPLLMSLGVNLQVTDGFAAPEFREVYERALAICEPEDADKSFPVLWGIWMFHKVRSELRDADVVARRMLALAETSGNTALLVQAHQSMCVTQMCLGNLAPALHHMHCVTEIYDPARHGGNAEIYGQDPLVTTLSFGSIAYQLDGQGDHAIATRDRAAEAATQLGRPSTLALSAYFTTFLHQLRGDAAATRAAAERTMELSAEDGFTFWLAGATILRGWAAAVEGNRGWGIAEIRRGQAAWTALGSRTYRTYHLGLLGDVLLRDNRPDEALPVLDEGLKAARDLPEGFYERELRRLRDRTIALQKSA
jgi:predicted ATPase